MAYYLSVVLSAFLFYHYHADTKFHRNRNSLCNALILTLFACATDASPGIKTLAKEYFDGLTLLG